MTDERTVAKSMLSLVRMRKVIVAFIGFVVAMVILVGALVAGAIDGEKFALAASAVVGWLSKTVIEGISAEDAAAKSNPTPATPPELVGLPGQK